MQKRKEEEEEEREEEEVGLGMTQLVDREVTLTEEERSFQWIELLIYQLNFIEAVLMNMREVVGHEEITKIWLVDLKQPLIYCYTLFTYINQTNEKTRESTNVALLLHSLLETKFSRKAGCCDHLIIRCNLEEGSPSCLPSKDPDDARERRQGGDLDEAHV